MADGVDRVNKIEQFKQCLEYIYNHLSELGDRLVDEGQTQENMQYLDTLLISIDEYIKELEEDEFNPFR